MKKFTAFALIFSFALGACQFNLPVQTNPQPTANLAVTVSPNNSIAATSTATIQPSPTTAPASDTPLPPPPTDTIIPNTDTPIPNLTTTPVTATSGPGDIPTVTFTPTLVPSGSLTASPTNGVLTYGTLPPENNPYVGITIINESKAEAYISLQVVTDQGYTIIEYPVKRTVKVKIPTGDYAYVVWVGGKQFVGYFHIGKNSDITIRIFKDKVEVQQG